MSNSMYSVEQDANRRDERFFRMKLLIHPQFQLTLIGINWAIITGMTLLLRVQAGRVFSDIVPLASISKIAGDFSSGYLEYQMDRLYTSLWVIYGIAMLLSGVITLIVSYRFAGPIIRMKGYFRELSRPDKPVHPLNFRGGDFFSDLPPLVNAAIKRLQGRP